MFPSFIVTFREILEVALVLGVVLAATAGLECRKRWIFLGIGLGILGSAAVAAFTGHIAELAEGMGQELFNAIILFTASFVIGWTALWMSTHAREMMANIREKGAQVVCGQLPLYTISLIIALAVLREGAEIVLFTYGMLASGQSWNTVLSGSALGLAAGGCVGFLLYKGLIAIPHKYIFRVTTWMLFFLSAGMASVGAKYLVSAGYFDRFSTALWDTSFLLSESSLPGQILHALFGYSEQPMAIQLIFYIGTLGCFALIAKMIGRKSNVASVSA